MLCDIRGILCVTGIWLDTMARGDFVNVMGIVGVTKGVHFVDS